MKRILCYLVLLMAPYVLAGETVVIATGEYPPFISETLPSNGPVSEIVVEAGRRAGIKIEIEFYPWKRVLIMLGEGEVPASFLWAKTKERLDKGFYDSEQAVSYAPTAAFYRRSLYPEGISFSAYADLKPYKLIGVESYWYHEELNKKQYEAHFANRSALAWRALEKGRYQVYIDSLQVGLSEAKVYAPELFYDLAYTTTQVDDPYTYMMFSPKHKDGKGLKKRLDIALTSMKQDGSFKQLHSKQLSLALDSRK